MSRIELSGGGGVVESCLTGEWQSKSGMSRGVAEALKHDFCARYVGAKYTGMGSLSQSSSYSTTRSLDKCKTREQYIHCGGLSTTRADDEDEHGV
nr:hypothetical protein CFP56_70564 [Quercus suber]